MLRAKLVGASGATKWRAVPNENAWAAMITSGVFGGASVQFQITHQNPYPTTAYPTLQGGREVSAVYSVDAKNYPKADGTDDANAVHATPSKTPFANLLGNVWGRLVWTGGNGSTNIDAAVTSQMV